MEWIESSVFSISQHGGVQILKNIAKGFPDYLRFRK